MNWKQFNEKYDSYRDDFNNQEFGERTRVSNLMIYEAVRELIRSKNHLKTALQSIDVRINTLCEELNKDLTAKLEKQNH